MSDLNTEIEGIVGDIRAVATWLSGSLAAGFAAFGDEVATQRTVARGDWQGETATAFGDRTQTLVKASDKGADTTGEVAALVDDLAGDLQVVQDQMADVRAKAAAGGLVVSGWWVRNPGSGPPAAGPSPAPDASPAEWDAWRRADQAVVDHNAKVEVWNGCVDLADHAWERWQAALEAAGHAWRRHDSTYVGLTAGLLSEGIQLDLIRRATPVLVADVDRLLTRAQQLRQHAQALTGPDGRVSDPQRYYDLLDEADRLDDAHPAARRALTNWELPEGLTRGLLVLDVAATGYGIYSDWDDEGPAQAITSNVVPATASILAGTASGAYIGGVVGSFIPVPGLGTAAGVVVGAAVGTAVGAFTSGAIDSLFDSGADSLGDWGGAVVDGVEEVGDTIGDVANGVGDVFDSIF